MDLNIDLNPQYNCLPTQNSSLWNSLQQLSSPKHPQPCDSCEDTVCQPHPGPCWAQGLFLSPKSNLGTLSSTDLLLQLLDASLFYRWLLWKASQQKESLGYLGVAVPNFRSAFEVQIWERLTQGQCSLPLLTCSVQSGICAELGSILNSFTQHRTSPLWKSMRGLALILMKYLWEIHLDFSCLQAHLAISVLLRNINGGLAK